MRRNSDIPAEPLVAIDVVAASVGHLPEIIWGKLKQSDVHPDWNHVPSVTWTKARQLFDEITAATAANDAANRKRIDEQMDREHFERTHPLRAYEEAKALGERNVRGAKCRCRVSPNRRGRRRRARTTNEPD